MWLGLNDKSRFPYCFCCDTRVSVLVHTYVVKSPLTIPGDLKQTRTR